MKYDINYCFNTFNKNIEVGKSNIQFLKLQLFKALFQQTYYLKTYQKLSL